MTELASLRSPRSVVPRGTGRIGLIRGYFTLFGVLGAISCVGFAAGMFSAYPSKFTMSRGQDLLNFANMLFMTVGFFRTDYLLKYWRRSGAWLAATCFTVDIGTNFIRSGGSGASAAISGIGLALVVSIWRELD